MQTQTTQTLSGDDPGASPAIVAGSSWPMHARGVGQMLDLAVDLFVDCLVPTVGLAFLMWLPVRIAWVLLGSAEAESAAVQILLNLIGATVVQTLSVALTIQIVYAELQGSRISMRQALLVAVKRGPALLGCSILVSMGTTAGCCALLVGAIFVMYIWSAAPAALVLESRGPLDCLVRSQQLVRKSFLRWAGVMLCAVALKLPFDAAAAFMDQPQIVHWALEEQHVSPVLYSLAQVFITSLLLAVSAAGWSIVITVFYLDCRVRREGFDLVMRLERLTNAALLGRAR